MNTWIGNHIQMKMKKLEKELEKEMKWVILITILIIIFEEHKIIKNYILL